MSKRIAKILTGAAEGAVGCAALVLLSTVAAAQTKECLDVNLEARTRIVACTRVIDNARESAEAKSDALSARGGLLDDGGQHAEAIADFTAALKIAPDDAGTLILRGNAYDAIGEKAKAVADYSEAIRLNPGDAAAFFNRASVFQEQGLRDKAVADYRAALKIDPEFDAAKQGLAELEEK